MSVNGPAVGHESRLNRHEMFPIETHRATDIADLKPKNRIGSFYLLFAIALTGVACWLSMFANLWLWFVGQLLLAAAMVQWFAILHEAGHKTLFRTRWLNKWAAHMAGFIALIPGDCWRIVHAKHHYWTGWQDLDLTTETLVPRRLHRVESVVINVCWRLWIPIFATLYRVNNYWNLPRLWRLFPRTRERRLLTMNIVFYLAAYLTLVWMLGFVAVLKYVGLGLLISFSLQDLLILSQHTHIPMSLANGEKVASYPPIEQEVFTRSLLFPPWFSRLVLLNIDAHSLHHMYPKIPGYHLHQISRETMNSIRWWQWIVKAKGVPGEVLLFQNRDQTGYFF
jgi:fatty acid desaturase